MASETFAEELREAVAGDKFTLYTELMLQAADLLDHKDEQINTRPAPAATDTGLETVGNITEECLLELKQMLCGEIHPCNDIGDVTDADIELCIRSQAEDLLAAKEAERAEQWRLRREMEADRDTQKAIAASFEAELAAERAEKDGWKELHDAAQVAVKERTEACNNLYKQVNDLKADNAAQAARIKELDGECNELVTKCNEIIGQRDHALNACAQMEEDKEALEAKLAAANEVAQLVIQAEEDKSGDPNFYILLMQTAYDKARAVLGGKPS